MKRFKFLALLIALFAVGVFSAIAGANELPDLVYSPHAESVQIWNGKVYVLFNTEYHEGWSYYDYMPTKIVEFDEDLNEQRSVTLEVAGGAAGKNAAGMALYDGKLYVGCHGGPLGAGFYGDIWEVDLEDMTAKQVLDVADVLDVPAEIYSIAIAEDGTTYCLIGYYDSSGGDWPWPFYGKLYVTTAEELSKGNIGTEAPASSSTSGAYWGLAYDDLSDTLWFMAGEQIEARNKNGTLLKAFAPADLGDNAGSISTWKQSDTSAKNGIFYVAITSDYSSSSVGLISRSGDVFSVQPDLVTNFIGDTQGFTFIDHNGNNRALVREYNYGPNDFIKIYDPSNWTTPIKDVSGWASNIHNLTTSGDYMYLTTYESYGSDLTVEAPGEVVRVNMADDYDPDKRYSAAAIIVPQEINKPELNENTTLPTGAPSDVHGDVMAATIMDPSVFDGSDLGISSADLVADEDYIYYLKADVAKHLAAFVWDGVTISDTVSLPVFTATVKSNDVAAVSFVLAGSSLLADKPENVKVLKAKGEENSLPFNYVSKAADFADGTFTVIKNGSIFSGTLSALEQYTLVLFIRDNKEYDLDPTEGAILDPTVIVKTQSASGGGGSSGCSASGASIFGLLAVLSLSGTIRRYRVKK